MRADKEPIRWNGVADGGGHPPSGITGEVPGISMSSSIMMVVVLDYLRSCLDFEINSVVSHSSNARQSSNEFCRKKI